MDPSGPRLPPRGALLRHRVTGWIVRGLAVYSAALVTLIGVAVLVGSHDARQRAILLMALGLLLLWVVLGGLLSLRYRGSVRTWFERWRGPWPLKFFLFATALILLEEAITTGMTNLAPEFGSQLGVAYITASNNYLLVIGFSSVVVIVPAFAGWALLLRRYDFLPNEVFLLFGLLGTTAEASLNPSALYAGFWFFVYGLMIYLPAFSLPTRPTAVTPRWYAYVLAYVVPLACQIPVVVLVRLAKAALGIHLYTD